MTVERPVAPVAEAPDQPEEAPAAEEQKEPAAIITVKTAPVTIQRGGEGGPTERIAEATTADGKPEPPFSTVIVWVV